MTSRWSRTARELRRAPAGHQGAAGGTDAAALARGRTLGRDGGDGLVRRPAARRCRRPGCRLRRNGRDRRGTGCGAARRAAGAACCAGPARAAARRQCRLEGRAPATPGRGRLSAGAGLAGGARGCARPHAHCDPRGAHGQRLAARRAEALASPAPGSRTASSSARRAKTAWLFHIPANAPGLSLAHEWRADGSPAGLLALHGAETQDLVAAPAQAESALCARWTRPRSSLPRNLPASRAKRWP